MLREFTRSKTNASLIPPVLPPAVEEAPFIEEWPGTIIENKMWVLIDLGIDIYSYTYICLWHLIFVSGLMEKGIDGREGLRLIYGTRVHGTTFKTRREDKVNLINLYFLYLQKSRRSVIFFFFWNNLLPTSDCVFIPDNPCHCNVHVHFCRCLVYLGKYLAISIQYFNSSIFFIFFSAQRLKKW